MSANWMLSLRLKLGTTMPCLPSRTGTGLSTGLQRCRQNTARPNDDDTTAINHGGISLFYKTVSHVSLPNRSTFESLAISLVNAGQKRVILAIYRPSTITGNIFEEFENTLEVVLSLNINFVILGDFTRPIHVDEW